MLLTLLSFKLYMKDRVKVFVTFTRQQILSHLLNALVQSTAFRSRLCHTLYLHLYLPHLVFVFIFVTSCICICICHTLYLYSYFPHLLSLVWVVTLARPFGNIVYERRTLLFNSILIFPVLSWSK